MDKVNFFSSIVTLIGAKIAFFQRGANIVGGAISWCTSAISGGCPCEHAGVSRCVQCGLEQACQNGEFEIKKKS